MSDEPDPARRLAQNLIELLSSYEEELMALERDAPALSQIRRAVGMTIAEACYWISDQPPADVNAAPPPDGGQAKAR